MSKLKIILIITLVLLILSTILVVGIDNINAIIYKVQTGKNPELDSKRVQCRITITNSLISDPKFSPSPSCGWSDPIPQYQCNSAPIAKTFSLLGMIGLKNEVNVNVFADNQLITNKGLTIDETDTSTFTIDRCVPTTTKKLGFSLTSKDNKAFDSYVVNIG